MSQAAYNAQDMMKFIRNASVYSSVYFYFLNIAYAADQPVYDMGIEGMRSQGYSIGIFAFMMVAMVVFLGVIGLFYKTTDMSSVKTGEKVLMGFIVLGVLVSAVFAAVQMLDGFLF